MVLDLGCMLKSSGKLKKKIPMPEFHLQRFQCTWFAGALTVLKVLLVTPIKIKNEAHWIKF